MSKETILRAEVKKNTENKDIDALKKMLEKPDLTEKIIGLINNAIKDLEKINNEATAAVSPEKENEQVAAAGGDVEVAGKLTAEVNAKIDANLDETEKVTSEAMSKIEELMKINESLQQQLEETKKALNDVIDGHKINNKEEEKMASLIETTGNLIDKGYSKETILEFHRAGGANEEQINKIKTVLDQHDLEQQTETEPTPIAEPTTEEIKPTVLPEKIPAYKEEINIPVSPDEAVEIYKPATTGPEPTPAVTPEPAPTSMSRATNIDQQARGINESGVFMMPENRSMFEKMSEGGRSILNKLYKGINPAPGVSRLIAKVGIGYNEFWINTKEESSSKLKDKMDGLDLEIKTFDQSKAKMQGVAETLRKNSNPGFAALEIEIKKINKQEAKIANKRDRIQSKIEKKENRARVFTNKRDAIADKMISKYEQKLSVIEGKLEVVTDERDRMELFIMGREVELDEDTKYFDDLEKSKNDIMRSLMSIGQSAEKAERNSAVKNLEKQIEIGRKKIEKTWEELQDKIIEIDEKVAKIDAEAEPYRDRRDQFVRVKDGRPIDFDLPLRNRLPNERVVEETSTHMRPEANHPAPSPTPTVDTRSPASAINKIPSIGERVTLLNEFIKKNNLTNSLQIDQTYLLNNTRLTREKEIDLAMFKKIIAGYYKVKKIPEVNYRTLLNNLR